LESGGTSLLLRLQNLIQNLELVTLLHIFDLITREFSPGVIEEMLVLLLIVRLFLIAGLNCDKLISSIPSE